MAFVNPLAPNAADFLTFLQNQPNGIPADDMPDSDVLGYALDFGEAWTISAPAPVQMQYIIAVYNCGMHWLLMNAQDATGQTYFASAQATYNLLAFVAGPVLSAADEGTSQTLAGSDAVRDMSLVAMDAIKTPWGKRWLYYQQAYGPTIVGYS